MGEIMRAVGGLQDGWMRAGKEGRVEEGVEKRDTVGAGSERCRETLGRKSEGGSVRVR